MVNSFMKRVRGKTNNYTVGPSLKKTSEDLLAFNFDLQNNNYYNSDLVNSLKKNIQNSLQEPFSNGIFINFTKIL